MAYLRLLSNAGTNPFKLLASSSSNVFAMPISLELVAGCLVSLNFRHLFGVTLTLVHLLSSIAFLELQEKYKAELDI